MLLYWVMGSLFLSTFDVFFFFTLEQRKFFAYPCINCCFYVLYVYTKVSIWGSYKHRLRVEGTCISYGMLYPEAGNTIILVTWSTFPCWA